MKNAIFCSSRTCQRSLARRQLVFTQQPQQLELLLQEPLP